MIDGVILVAIMIPLLYVLIKIETHQITKNLELIYSYIFVGP